MVNKYSAKLSGLKRTKFENKTEKQQAKYFAKQFEELGLAIPKYMKNGKMSSRQLASNINKLTKALQTRAKKETQANKNLNKRAINKLNEYKKAYNKYVNSLSEEYRKSKVFMRYFTEGHSLKTSSHDVDSWGKDFTYFPKLKDMRKHYQEDDMKKLIEIMDYQIKEMNNNPFDKQVKRLKEKAYNEIDRLEQELNDGMESPNSKGLKKMINTNQLQYHELLELTQLLENYGNVFDSIYQNNRLGGGMEDFNTTINIIYKCSKRYNLDDYMN